jgi:hypothetical protein
MVRSSGRTFPDRVAEMLVQSHRSMLRLTAYERDNDRPGSPLYEGSPTSGATVTGWDREEICCTYYAFLRLDWRGSRCR